MILFTIILFLLVKKLFPFAKILVLLAIVLFNVFLAVILFLLAIIMLCLP
jgi:hypothetical protein